MDAPGSLSTAKRCIACGAVLGRLDAAVGDHCRTLACRTWVAVQVVGERKRLAAERDDAVASAHFEGRDVARFVRIPAMTSPVVPADPARVEHFRRTLAAAMAEAAELVATDGEARPLPDGTSGGVFSAACRTCGGHCCGHGGTHAFLTAHHLADRLRVVGAPSAADLAAAYLARLPDRSVENGCVFHGEAGCTLDRDLRSDVCNQYLCEGLRRLTMVLGDEDVGIVAVEDGVVIRSSVV